MILIAYRHGLRASELTGLRWDMLDLAQGHLHVQAPLLGNPRHKRQRQFARPAGNALIGP